MQFLPRMRMTNLVLRMAIVIAFFILLPPPAFCQEAGSGDSTMVPAGWYLMNYSDDHFPGCNTENAYALLAGRPSKPVLVAVVDSGVDIDHEDLQGHIWTNENEIPDNGIDDDNNGYVDDIHGWNFIGGKDGTNVNQDTYEVTREYARLGPRFEQVPENKIKRKDRKEYEYWKKVKAKYDNDSRFNRNQYDTFKQQFVTYFNVYKTLYLCDSLIRNRMHVDEITPEVLEQVDTANDTLNFAKGAIQRLYDNIEGEVRMSDVLNELEHVLAQYREAIEDYGTAVEFGYNTQFDTRKIVGDDPNNLHETGYGNNDVTGPFALHGTHTAGVIAADRNNDIGIRGIANDVLIMSVRTVPNGDERDKDVANAIRYAVDNGARIINMSFGKSLSPHKEIVDAAVHYAESHGVLLIHAAGNDSHDNDKRENFPNRQYLDSGEAKNWIEVGASSWSLDENLAASFSNYGKKGVDLFAPGVDIMSTEPGDAYDAKDGTSFACPVVAGVAAMIMSYFPELTNLQVRKILVESVSPYKDLKVLRPGSSNEILPFGDLSVTGGLIDAGRAVELALKTVNSEQRTGNK